jgi:hypothetical protein
VHSRTIADIRSVDFKNFSFDWYPRWANTPSNGRKIVLGGGSMDTGFGYGKEPRKFFLIDEPVEYGDLTRDGHEDAVVVLGVITSGTSRPNVVLVYTIASGQPKRLWAYETGDRWDYGYHSASIRNGELIIERYKPFILVYHGQKHNMSSSNFYVRDHYKWNGARFQKLKTLVIPADANDRAPWARRI